ncbi:MAG: MutS-related protein, partial [Candidatus Promineifilaceae bacterium]
ECPIELDLDLAGDFSLLRLIDTTVSTGGAQRLRAWLSSTEPDRGEVLSRQQLVRELVPRPLFRDKLALSGKMAAREDSRWHSDDLLTWLESDDRSSAIFPWLLLSAGLAAINIILFLLDILAGFPPIWQGTLVVYFALFLIKSRDLDKPFREASHLRDALEQLVAVFKQLEEYSYHQTPNLRMLCRSFLDPAGRPSRQLARVNRVVSATGIRGNFVLWLILNLAVPWDFYFAYLTAVRKREIASLLPTWMEAWFEIEALSSLANLAYLNPHYTFPEISDPEIGSEVVFKTKKMGHPLLHDQGKVCNDFAIESVGEIDLFTGSNMSGKSTFLRTVGINLALAFAGGPVDAELFETIPFRLYTCIRISDSVTDGISYFYAEVKCLKALLDELNRDHPLPLFYFIDEIFRGTNNRERLMGSSAYIQALAGKFGVGLIATHDLELIQLADAVPVIRNYHFTDEIKDGKMYFDYTLRRGPSPTTNALKIMEMEGLPVPK